MSQELDFSEFRRAFEGLDRVKDALPEIKKEFLDRMGGEMFSAVRGNLGGEGKVQSWQEARVGSRHGYAAVSPKAKTYQETKNSRHAVGYVTNAIERGHRIRSPSGQAKERYRPRIKQPKVTGRFFYKSSESEVARLAEAGAKDLAEKLVQKIEEEMSK